MTSRAKERRRLAAQFRHRHPRLRSVRRTALRIWR